MDRGALDAALEHGLSIGGWCPKGRRSEDGSVPARYPLRETSDSTYGSRTRRNVLDSDASLILMMSHLESPGTALTAEIARRESRPILMIDLETPSTVRLRDWLRTEEVRVLNVAGPRESECPGVQALAESYLSSVFREAGVAAGDS